MRLAAADAVDADAYRVHSIMAGVELAAVWFPGASAGRLPRPLQRLKGTISVGAKLHPSASEAAADQLLTVFLTEAASARDTRRLVRWARPTPAATHSALTVVEGTVLAPVIARSFVADVEAHETNATLQRFAGPFAAALGSTRPGR